MCEISSGSKYSKGKLYRAPCMCERRSMRMDYRCQYTVKEAIQITKVAACTVKSRRLIFHVLTAGSAPIYNPHAASSHMMEGNTAILKHVACQT
jgi:hypothetical protein